MTFELGLVADRNRKFLTLSKIFLAALIVAIAAVLQLSAFSTSANAASATAGINTCDKAIASMNKTLTLIAKRRIAVRTAKKAGAKKVKRAKKLLKNSQKQGNKVRAAIKSHCFGANGVSALDAKCSLAITSLEKAINVAVTRKLAYKKIKGKGKKAKKRKRTMKTRMKKADAAVKAQTQNFQKACSGTGTGVTGSNTGGGGTGGTPDTTPPGLVTIEGPTGTTNDNTPTFTITPPAGETGGHIECKIDDGDYVTVTSPYTTPELSDGTHTITCRYVDAAGNVGDPTTVTVVVDTTGSTDGPTITIPGSGPGGEINDPTPEVIVDPPAGETGGHLECKISGSGYNGEFVEFTTVTSPWILPELPEGTYTITCRYVDEAGNPGTETSYTIVIDYTAPGAPVVSGPTGPTQDTTPEITVTTTEPGGTVKCRVDDGVYSVVSSPFSTATLSDGTHVITCYQQDAAGNDSPTGQTTVTVDTTAPGSVTISGPQGATSDTTPSFNLSGAQPGDNYECKTDNGAFAQTGSVYTTSTLSEGVHTVTCHLVDAAGNLGPDSSANVTIDNSAPGSVTITGPTNPTNDNTPTFTITPSEPGGSIECKVDGGAFQTVTSPYTTSALADGTHTITCHHKDGANNTGPDASASVTIDTTPPSAIAVNGPSGLTNDNTPTYAITGGGSGVTYQCKVDGGSYANVTSPFTSSALADGAHTITCRAVDAAGNAGTPVVSSITVDTVAPTITVTDGAVKWDGTHVFNIGSSESATIKCGIDGGAQSTVSSPYTTAVLANGTHTINCSGTDAAGNVSTPVIKQFGVFKDPTVVSKSGGFQWGLACTGSSFLNAVLGCPDDGLSISIPANPNGLTGDYLVDVAGEIKKLSGVLGLGSKYTMYISVDGQQIASDSQTVVFDIFGIFAANLDASKTNISLSASTAHTIQISLKTSALINVLPNVQSSELSVSIHH